jgi:hypothetical protein
MGGKNAPDASSSPQAAADEHADREPAIAAADAPIVRWVTLISAVSLVVGIALLLLTVFGRRLA